MKKKSTNIFFVSLQLFSTTQRVFAEPIKIAADNWCPFTCVDAQNPGIIIEIGQKILEKKGIESSYEVVSWPKAVRDSVTGKVVILAGASRPDGNHLVFPLEEQGIQKSCVYFSKMSSKINSVKTISDLKNLKLGVVQNYSYGEPLDSILFSKQKRIASGIRFEYVKSASPTLELYENLLAKKIDAFVESNSVLSYSAKVNKWKEIPEPAFCFESLSVYLSISERHPRAKEFAIWITEGTQQMRLSGELKVILEKYGIEDWKPQIRQK